MTDDQIILALLASRCAMPADADGQPAYAGSYHNVGDINAPDHLYERQGSIVCITNGLDEFYGCTFDIDQIREFFGIAP